VLQSFFQHVFFFQHTINFFLYLSDFGVYLPLDAVCAGSSFVLLPINSALNPLLYSKLIGQYMSRARKLISDNLLVICPRHVDDATKVDGSRERMKEKSIPIVGNYPLQLREIRKNC